MYQIEYVDQTPFYFNMSADSTINVVGGKTVHVRTSGYEKQQCTVMLTVLTGGKKASTVHCIQKNCSEGQKITGWYNCWMPRKTMDVQCT